MNSIDAQARKLVERKLRDVESRLPVATSRTKSGYARVVRTYDDRIIEYAYFRCAGLPLNKGGG